MNSKPLTPEDVDGMQKIRRNSIEVMRQLSTGPCGNKTNSKRAMFDFHKGIVLDTIEPPYFFEGLTESDLDLDSCNYGMPFTVEPGNYKAPVILGAAVHVEHARLHKHVKALAAINVMANTSHGMYGKDNVSNNNLWDINTNSKDLTLTYKHNIPIEEVHLYEKLVDFANYNKQKPKPTVGERKKLSIVEKDTKKKKNSLSRKSRKANRR